MYLFYILGFLTFALEAIADEASSVSKTDYVQAVAYENGDGVSKDSFKAFNLFLQCAKGGDPKAKYKVGLAYFNGTGVSKDQVEGLAWMYNAVNSGISSSSCASMEEALTADKIAQAKVRAKEQNPTALNQSAIIESEANIAPSGNISSVDFQKLRGDIKRFSQDLENAKKGDLVAANSLGHHYYHGVGTPQNYGEAVKWWHYAADRGNADSQEELGISYLNGIGVAEDHSQAYLYLALAKKVKLTTSEYFQMAEKTCNLAEKREAQRLLREWSPQPQTTP